MFNLPIATTRLRVICLAGICGLLVFLLAGAGGADWLGKPRAVRAASANLPDLADGQDTQQALPHDCISPEQRAQIARNIETYEAQYGPVPAIPNVVQSYPFHPQAGTLWQDLAIGNFVDLDPSSAIQIFDCSTHSYNGHTGHDVGFGYFREMAIGIPIFAALDGTVVDAHDGEFDMNTIGIAQCNPSPPANYVVLDHGGGHRTIYFHMKKNSVAVSIGQVVTAGTQLGLVGSSGCSSAPHLHFESQLNNQAYEPYAGACRAGASNWVNQIPVRQDMYARDFYFSDASPNYLNDQRLGTFVMGNGTLVWFHLEFANRPAGGTQRIRYFRPNGTTATDFTNPNLTTEFFIGGENIALFVNLDTTGTWRMLYQVNGQTIMDAPLTVVVSPAQIVNRPPNPITVSFDPPAPQPGEVIFCRVNTSLYLRDPDYDIVRYRFQWRVNGTLIRDITSATLSDALAKGMAPPNASVTCTVTPSDGTASAPSAVVSATVGCPTITITPATLPNGALGTAYNQNLTQSGGSGTITWSISAGALPGGLALNSTSGVLSGTPTGTGAYNFTVRAADANTCTGLQAYSLTITGTCPAITVNPATLPNGFAGTAYNQTFTATGGTAPYTFSVSAGTLPNGLTLNANTGALAGTPTTPGTFNFTVQAMDANGCTGTRAYTVIISGSGPNSLVFYPLPRPVRLLDTRAGQGNCDNISTPIPAGTSLTTLARLTCEGITIPPTAQAITGNLTVINQTAQIGYLTIYPDGQPVPLASNMIYEPGGIIANNFTVGLSADGKFNVFGERTIDVVIDISGYYAPPGASGLYYHPLSKPIRLLDSRPNQGNCDNVSTPIPAGTSITTLARVTCEGLTIPSAAQAIVANATVINGSGQIGYLTIYPNGVPVPLASNLIYYPGQILANAFTVSLNASGEFNIFGERTIDIVVDVAGYYSNEATDVNGAGLLFTALSRPLRTLDTRAGQGNCDAVSTPITGGNSIATPGRLTCEGITIPSAAQSIIGNVTVINQTGMAGYLTLYPDGLAQPLVSNMIYFPNQILSNAFVVGLNTGTGQFRIFAERTLDAIVDVSGYFAP